MEKKYTAYILTLIIVIGILFRFPCLSSNPSGFFRDEAEKGYTAYSIMKTGGYRSILPGKEFRLFPVFIETPGSATSAIYQYTAIPFIYIFGLNELGTRLPAAVFGTLTILMLFLFARKITDENIALLAVFFLAISPWHIIFSRWALQGIMIPFYITAGFFLFEKGRNKDKKWLWLLSGLSLGIAFYGYIGFRIFILMLMPVFLLVFRKDFLSSVSLKYTIPSIFIFLLITIPVLFYMTTAAGAERMMRVSLINAPDMSIFEKGLALFLNYVKYYSPAFLMYSGDSNLRHSFPWMGVLSYVEFPFFVAGLFLTIRRRSQWDLMLLYWFFIYPCAAALTKEDSPHALRSLCAVPMPQIFAASGAIMIFDKIKKYAAAKYSDGKKQKYFSSAAQTVFIIAAGLTILFQGYVIYGIYPKISAQFWQYGIREAIEESKKSIDYDNNKNAVIYLSGKIIYAPYFILFYDKINPAEFNSNVFENLRIKLLPPDFTMDNVKARHIKENTAFILMPEDMSTANYQADISVKKINYPQTEDSGSFTAFFILAKK